MEFKSVIRRIFQITILMICFMATIAALISANWIERLVPEWRSQIAVGTGLVFGALLFILIRYLQKIQNISCDFTVFKKDYFFGLIYSVIAFIISAAVVWAMESGEIGHLSLSEIFNQLLFQIRPVLIEEIGFRYGIVVFALAYFGKSGALIAGSIPFGILHLLHFLSGQPIYWDYIFGTAIAGLFLTIIFLRWGIGAAILAHYTWNVLASLFSSLSKIPQEKIEGGYGTLCILIVLSGFLLWSFKRSPASIRLGVSNKF